MAVDPVCGMEVSRTDNGRSVRFDGETYYFCSDACKKMFEEDPGDHVDSGVPNTKTVYHHNIPRIPYGCAEGEFDISVQDEDQLQVGDSVTFTRCFREEDVRKFAEASGDTNALHLNEQFAQKTRFEGRIVHGTLVASLISAGLACFPGLTIYLNQNLEFERPARIGETLTACCAIVEQLENQRYRMTTRVENTEGEILIHGTATVLIDAMPQFE